MKLLDGTKAYIHGVIDNYSRKILSWTVADHMDIESTCTVLLEAAKFLEPKDDKTPTLYCDSGVENINHKVDELIFSGLFTRILAQVDVTLSNSMIEAYWRSLRHQWLYLNNLSDMATVRRLVRFYVHQHNEVMPHAAFKGQTPDEMYSGKGQGVLIDLAKARELARAARLKANRDLDCGKCPVKGKK